MKEAQTVLITGASRGLGLAFAESFAQLGWRVYACARKPSDSPRLSMVAKRHPERVRQIALDVSSTKSVKAAAKKVGASAKHLDLLINNAGIIGSNRSVKSGNDEQEILDVYNTNVIGPLRVTRAFLPLLKKGRHPKLVQITSLMGSMADNTSGGYYPYRLSKAALNMLSKNFSIDYAKDGIISVAIHPGWVKTEMGGPNARLSIGESVPKMVELILSLQKKHSGSFLWYDGRTAPY